MHLQIEIQDPMGSRLMRDLQMPTVLVNLYNGAVSLKRAYVYYMKIRNQIDPRIEFNCLSFVSPYDCHRAEILLVNKQFEIVDLFGHLQTTDMIPENWQREELWIAEDILMIRKGLANLRGTMMKMRVFCDLKEAKHMKKRRERLRELAACGSNLFNDPNVNAAGGPAPGGLPQDVRYDQNVSPRGEWPPSSEFMQQPPMMPLYLDQPNIYEDAQQQWSRDWKRGPGRGPNDKQSRRGDDSLAIPPLLPPVGAGAGTGGGFDSVSSRNQGQFWPHSSPGQHSELQDPMMSHHQRAPHEEHIQDVFGARALYKAIRASEEHASSLGIPLYEPRRGREQLQPAMKPKARVPEATEDPKPEKQQSIPRTPMDDPVLPFPTPVAIKVTTIHPTTMLHNAHIQNPEFFPRKPEFATTYKTHEEHTVLCRFSIKDFTLYSQVSDLTKSDAKLMASRAMIEKMKSLNVLLICDTRTKQVREDEHPRCRLMWLHDTYPDTFPNIPHFTTTSHPRSSIVVTCSFNCGDNTLVTKGTGATKKKAIIHAALQMLKAVPARHQTE